MLKKILIPTVIISGTLLTCFTVLLVSQGSKPVEVQMDNRQVFYGKFKDVFTPPVAGLTSIAVAVTTAMVIGCQQSMKRSFDLEKKISTLQQQILEKESEIETLKLAPESPVLAKLNWFLEQDDERFYPQHVETETLPLPLNESVPEFEPVSEPVVKESSGYDYQVITSNSASVQASASLFSSVQSVAGLTRRK